MASRLSSVDKILDILCLFDSKYLELSAHEISALLNLPSSSTYKYLDILLKRGFLTKDNSSKKYCLGSMIYKLGSRFSEKRGFLDIVITHMKSLSYLSNETVFLSIVNGWEAMIIEKIEPSKTVKLSVEKGAKIPLHAGAAQKVLLAYQEDTFIDAVIKKQGLSKMTPNTIADPDELKKELTRIKGQGFAFSDSEVHSWIMAVAAPIFNHEKMVLAGLAIAVPRDRAGNNDMQKLIMMVKECAIEVSKELGYGGE